MKHLNQINSDIITDSQMRWYNIAFIIFCMIMFLVLDLSGQDMTAKFDSIVNQVVEDPNGPGYAIQISKDGKTIYQKAVGMANLELGVPITPDHVFRIGSITKQFTTAAILRLQEQGKMSVKDDLIKYIPDYPTHDNKITVEHLMVHTSGIKSYTSMPKFRTEFMSQHMSPMELIDVFKDEPMDFKTGEKEMYNNSAYIILGYIIEKVSGKTYEDYIETEFFEPLGMNNSSYEVSAEIINNRAYGYDSAEGNYVNAPYISMALPYAAGSLLSTTDDLRKWHTAYMNDEVVSAESRKVAHTSATLNDGKKTGYGYGWGLGEFKGSKRIGHSGGIPGFLSDSQYFLEEKILVTVLSNCNCHSAQEVIMPLAATAIGKPIIEPDAVDLDLVQAQKYVGIYKLSPKLNVAIELVDGKLKAKPSGQESVFLKAIGDHKFFIKEISSELVFHPEPDGSVNSLTLFQGGAHKAHRLDMKPIDLSSNELKKYVGTFTYGSGQTFIFRLDNNKLYGKAGPDEVSLTPVGKHEFLTDEDNVKVIFSQEGDGAVNQVTVYMGGEIIATRMK